MPPPFQGRHRGFHTPSAIFPEAQGQERVHQGENTPPQRGIQPSGAINRAPGEESACSQGPNPANARQNITVDCYTPPQSGSTSILNTQDEASDEQRRESEEDNILDVQLGNRYGSGAAETTECIDRKTGKRLLMEKFNSSLQLLERQIQVQRTLRAYGAVERVHSYGYVDGELVVFKEQRAVCTLREIIDMCGGECLESMVKRYVSHIVRAMQHVRSCGYRYERLRSDEILIDKQGIASVSFRTPLVPISQADVTDDSWELGYLTFEIYTGLEREASRKLAVVVFKVLSSLYPPEVLLGTHNAYVLHRTRLETMSSELNSFISECFRPKDPTNFMDDLAALFQHSFMANAPLPIERVVSRKQQQPIDVGPAFFRSLRSSEEINGAIRGALDSRDRSGSSEIVPPGVIENEVWSSSSKASSFEYVPWEDSRLRGRAALYN
eukprot:gb/GECG01007581.1/.p1 GENE.gb/GECG01007581.1/~~gb/GECG01007581.1/.p1  ORF type:complete len:440 (+),score=46.65 gb/GECG01007581.1/:1-1320(+)